MKAPFKAIFEYLKSRGYLIDEIDSKKGPIEVFCDTTRIDQSSFENYMQVFVLRGKEMRPQYPKTAKSFANFYNGLCILLKLNEINYKNEAFALIDYLANRNEIEIEYINYPQYRASIKQESIPTSRLDFTDFIQCIGKDRKPVFYSFIYEYINLTKNEEYLDFIPSHRINNALPFELKRVDQMGKHMPQCLIDPKSGMTVFTENVHTHTCDFSFFRENPLIVISGKGGQGKSEFIEALRIIHHHTHEVFDEIIYFPLVNLTYTYQMTAELVGDNWIEDYIKLKYRHVDLHDPNKKYLLLLDGFNEMREAKEGAIASKITKNFNTLVKMISATEKHRLSLVVTTRELESLDLVFDSLDCFRCLTLSGTNENIYSQVKSKCQECGIPFDNTELAKLAEIPLYARMICDLSADEVVEEVKDKYSLLNTVYRARSKQRIAQEESNAEYDDSFYTYMYYVFLPYVAFRTAVSPERNSYRFDQDDLEKIITDLKKDGMDKVLFESVVTDLKLKRIHAVLPEIDSSQAIRFFENEESFIIKKTDFRFSFEHEEWRDFLICKYLNTVIKYLKLNYNKRKDKDILSIQMDFNVSSNVCHGILQSLNLDSDDREENARKALDYFKISEDDVKNHLYGSIYFIHVVFSLYEYCRLLLPLGAKRENLTLQDLFAPLYRCLKSYHCDKKIKNNDRISDKIRNVLLLYVCEILSKVCEYYRLSEDYKQLYAYLKVSEQFDPQSSIMLQQKAKMYLRCFEIKLKNESCDAMPEEIAATSMEELFKTGKEILEENMQFHLSGNTLGLLISTPSPCLLERMTNVELDYCKALRSYLSIMYGTGKRYVRRDVSYTVKQALRLLLLGYVYVTDDSTFDPTDPYSSLEDSLRLEVCNPLFTPKINSNTLFLINNMLEKVEEQESPGLNYLRGLACLNNGLGYRAEYFFRKPISEETITLMYDLLLKYYFEVNNRDTIIESQYRFIANKILEQYPGRFDSTFWAYYYIDGRQMELNLVDKEQKEAKQAWFSEFEMATGIHKIVKSIYDFIT